MGSHLVGGVEVFKNSLVDRVTEPSVWVVCRGGLVGWNGRGLGVHLEARPGGKTAEYEISGKRKYIPVEGVLCARRLWGC